MTMLTLLCGANPKTAKDGPCVRLHPGKWHVEIDAKDSKFSIYLDGQDVGHEFTLDKPGVLQARFQERGSESHVNVWVRKVA